MKKKSKGYRPDGNNPDTGTSFRLSGTAEAMMHADPFIEPIYLLIIAAIIFCPPTGSAFSIQEMAEKKMVQ